MEGFESPPLMPLSMHGALICDVIRVAYRSCDLWFCNEGGRTVSWAQHDVLDSTLGHLARAHADFAQRLLGEQRR